MKSYTITVNGNVYDVTVEEKVSVDTPAAKAAQATQKSAPIATPIEPSVKAVQSEIKAAASAPAGSIQVKANVPGKVFKIEASVGQTVKKGDNLLILEAMKMEIPVVAPEGGTVSSINVAVGASVETGDVLASLK
ncbi:MAG: biotin/lipoyl-containing protein [Clostridiaceae bacterium]